jgi:leucine dehydrogenase
MKISRIDTDTHETVIRAEDAETGLTGFIAVHSTQLGPAAGGLRMRPYGSEEEALEDVLRLSEGMTYKNAAAGLPLGGGKAVIIGDPAKDKTRALLQAFGRAIDTLKGSYITAEDMGMSPSDMAVIAGVTPHVVGLAEGAFASGDPSPITARGIFNALRTAWAHKEGRKDLTGVRVAVQGLGHVGWHLCKLLTEAGAALTVTDIDAGRIAEAEAAFGAKAETLDGIYGTEADIFAPCAIGGILNEKTIPLLKARVVAGGANNQLLTAEDGARLHARGILYAPDFVANGGGIINCATEILKIKDREGFVAEKLTALDATMQRILNQAKASGTSPDAAAIATVRDIMARPAA